MSSSVPVTTPELVTTLHKILKLACGAIPFDKGAIHLIQDGALWTRAVLAHPGVEVDAGMVGTQLSLDAGFCGFVARTGETFLSPLVSQETRLRPTRYSGANLLIQSFLGVPLRSDQQVIGVLEMDSLTPNFFQPHHIELAEVVADQAALAIENAWLYSESEAQNRALRTGNAQLSALLDATESGIVMSDAEGHLVHVNSVFCRLFDLNPATLLGMPVAQIIEQLAPRFSDPDSFRERSTWLYEQPHVVAHDTLVSADSQAMRLFQRYSAPVYGNGSPQERSGRIEVYSDVTDNRHLEQQMRQYLDEMLTVHRVGVAMGSEQDLTRLLRLVCEQASALVGATGAAVALVDDREPGRLRIPVTFGLEELSEERMEPLEVSVAGTAIHLRRPSIISPDSPPDDKAKLHQQWQMASSLSVPLESSDQVIGVLMVFSQDPRSFNDHDVQLLQIFASQAAVSIENTRLLRVAQARHDELMGATASIGRSRSNLNAILQSMTEGVIALDDDERIIFINQPLFDLFRVEPSMTEAWVGRPARDLGPFLGEIWQLVEERAVDPSESVRVVVEMKESGRAIELVHAPIVEESAQRTGHLLLLHDITQLRASERMKDELISVLSHELRTPLTSILGYSKLLADRVDSPQDKRLRWASHILEKSRLLNRLINEVLDLSRLNLQRLDLKIKESDLGALLRRLVDEQQMGSEIHRFRLELEGELQSVLLDPDRLDQLVTNLLINAIKYSPEGGEIVISARRAVGNLHVDVQDAGIGIDPEYHERIFEPFFRVDNSTTRNVYGTGLGLPLCRGIARAHGGDLTLESVPGQGTTFHIRLPLP